MALNPPKKSDLVPRVNSNIKAELARRDVSDATVMSIADVSADTLRRRRRGESPWSLPEIQAIADLLEIDAVQLFRE